MMKNALLALLGLIAVANGATLENNYSYAANPEQLKVDDATELRRSGTSYSRSYTPRTTTTYTKTYKPSSYSGYSGSSTHVYVNGGYGGYGGYSYGGGYYRSYYSGSA